jgi:Uma2 family endonuclease
VAGGSLAELELHVDGDVLLPDDCGWRWDRFDVDGDVVGIGIAPDWVCEVISPSTARADRVLKMPAYARIGVPHLWIVDPVLRTIEVYERADVRWPAHRQPTRLRTTVTSSAGSTGFGTCIW